MVVHREIMHTLGIRLRHDHYIVYCHGSSLFTIVNCNMMV